MELTNEQVSYLKEKAKKDPEVKLLLDFYNSVMDSNAYEDYISLKAQVGFWMQEVKEQPTSIRPVVKNNTYDSSSFDNVLKLFEKRAKIDEALLNLRTQLTPEKAIEAEVASTSLIDEARRKIRKG